MLRNKGTDVLLLKWNGFEIPLSKGGTLNVGNFGIKDDKDKSILEDRFIAKYPDSIERVAEEKKKSSTVENATGPGPDKKEKFEQKGKKK